MLFRTFDRINWVYYKTAGELSIFIIIEFLLEFHVECAPTRQQVVALDGCIAMVNRRGSVVEPISN